MAISSASTRIFKSQDPVMETDLELLAKVNTYEEAQFERGSEQVQNEINNWSLLANVAKPQDRDYINAKLNKLVSGVNALGGVDLGDPNNVNSLKSLGFNLYGDDNVMNPVVTSQKMKALSQDIAAKSNGKNAKDYDATYGEYLLNQYNGWLNDGQQGTSFNGPTSLPVGSFDQYTTKIQNEVNKLKPDITSEPVGVDKLNYYQTSKGWVSKQRVEQAIDALTNENDKNLITAHGWKSMAGVPDQQIVQLSQNSYLDKNKQLQRQLAYFNSEVTGKDFQTQQYFKEQAAATKAAIDQNNSRIKELNSYQGQPLPQGLRDDITHGIFFGAFKDEYSNARAYTENKTELKANTAKMFETRLAFDKVKFDSEFNLKSAQFELQKHKQAFDEEKFLKEYELKKDANGKLSYSGINSSNPYSEVLLSDKENVQTVTPETIKFADDVYKDAQHNFATNVNNSVATLPEFQNDFNYDPATQNYIPKNPGVESKIRYLTDKALSKIDMVSRLPLTQRPELTDFDKEVARNYDQLNNAKFYKDQVHNVSEEAFRLSGEESPSKKIVRINFKDGTGVNVSYSKIKDLENNDPETLARWQQKAVLDPVGQQYGVAVSTFDAIKNNVDEYYNNPKVRENMADLTKNVTVNKFFSGIPADKKGRKDPLVVKQTVDLLGKNNVNTEDIDPKTVDFQSFYVVPGKNGIPQKKAVIQYKSGSGSDAAFKTATVDVTDFANNAPGSFIGSRFAQNDVSLQMAQSLNTSGKYNGTTTSDLQLSHQYNVYPVKENNAIVGYRVEVGIPDEKTKSLIYRPVPYMDGYSSTKVFPKNELLVQKYMNSVFGNIGSVMDFYKSNNVTFEKAQEEPANPQ